MRLLISFLLLLSFGLAQESKQSVEGSVQDPSHAVIPKCVVVLQGAVDDTRRWSATTDPSGRFAFEGIPQGRYTLDVSHDGFKHAQVPLEINARKIRHLVIVLSIAAVNETVQVGNNDSVVAVDSASNQDALSENASMLQDLPIFDQDYITALSGFLDQSQIATGGVSLVVDGMESTKVGLSPSAIQQVKINNDPYAAEYFRPGRGRIEVITKPAAPEYHGEFNFTFRDYHLNASNRFAQVNPPEQRRIYEGSLTGPIGKSGKTFFLLSVDRQEEDLQAVVHAQDLSGLVTGNVPNPQRNIEVAGKVTHILSDKHNVTLQYSFEQDNTENQGVGGVVLSSAGINMNSREQQYKLTDTLFLTPSLLSQVQIRLETNHDETTSASADRKIVVLDSFTTGGAQVSRFRTEKDIQFNWLITWTKKKQTVKAGVNIPNISRRFLLDRSNFGGTYYFSDLQSYASNTPYAFTAQQGNGRLVYKQDEIGGFVQDEIKIRANLSVNLGLRYDWQNAFRDDNDFAPRASFAYAPGKNGKTVIRGGTGVFYDRTGAGPIADIYRYDGFHLNSYTLTNPTYPNPFVGVPGLSSQPPNLVSPAPNVVIPYTVQYGLSFERQVGKATISAGYRGSEGAHLFRSRDINAPLGPLYALRPDPSFGIIRQIESTGSMTLNALDISLKGKIGKHISGLAQYTFSKTLNDTAGITYFPANSYDLSGEWGRADTDQRHRLNLLEVWKAGDYFKLGVGVTLASGKPYTITTGLDPFGDGFANARPPGVSRNSAQGPGYAEVDLRWSHDFKLVPARKEKSPLLTLAFDAFNVFNQTNYVTYIGNQSSPFFGRAVAELPTRRLQVTGRFEF